MTTLFNKNRASNDAPKLRALMTAIASASVANPGQKLVTQDVAKTAMALEGFHDESHLREMDTAIKGLSTAMESFIATAALEGVSEQSKDAALAGAAIASDVRAVFSRPVRGDQPMKPNTAYVNPTGADMFYEHPLKTAMESYDERDNRHVSTFTTAYNMMASRQGPFAEMFFPTVTVAPDQVGFETTIRINSIMSEVKRGIEGNAADFKKKNLIQAVIDPEIFKPDQTKLIPVYRDESVDKFVDAALITPVQKQVGDEFVTSSALKMNKKLGLIDISQTAALLAAGIVDQSDAVDTAVKLSALYLKLSGQVNGAGPVLTEVFKFNTKNLGTAVFTHALQGLDRQMNLAFASVAPSLSKHSLTVSNAPSVLLASMAEGEVAYLELGVSGSVNLQTSETMLWAKGVTVASVIDADNAAVPTVAGAGLALVNLIEASTLIGYDLDAQRTNSNRRQRGELLDTVFFNQIYTVPLRSPLSIARPQSGGDENDASDLAALITATHIKLNNDAIKTLLEAADYLEEYVREQVSFDTAPAILGIASKLVTPHFRRQSLDVRTVVQTLTSTDKYSDIGAGIVGVIRDLVFNAVRDSGWQAAADALAGGNGGKPKILIGTDTVIGRYLTVSGDARLLGDQDYQVQVETTLNKTMKGLIVISFGQDTNTGAPNPMHFGNMAYKSENAIVLPTHRTGQNSKELTVTPSYLHIVNLPIMIVLEITGLSELAQGVVAVPTKEQP